MCVCAILYHAIFTSIQYDVRPDSANGDPIFQSFQQLHEGLPCKGSSMTPRTMHDAHC